MRLWRSVVGKIWGTILLLVTVVLLLLTILLLQSFENFHVGQVEDQMGRMADKVATLVQEDPDSDNVYKTASEIIDANSARVVIIGGKYSHWISPNSNNLPVLTEDMIQKDPDLHQVLVDHNKIKKQMDLKISGDDHHERVVVAAVPLKLSNGQYGAVFVYESLKLVNQSNDYAKKIIYISAGIGIILTTIFAFFLSTRIAAPLRDMKKAAQEIAKGSFDRNVPVITRDEIGELGVAFNKMASQLQANLTALNQEKEQLSGILSSMADGVMTFDKEGKLLISNPPAKRLLHSWWYETHQEEERVPVARDLTEVPPSIRELFYQVVTEVKEQTAEVSYQGRTWVLLMTPLYDQKIVRGAVAVLRDMTEERRLDELRQGFIANVSHELRTPISMLQGYSEAIVDDVVSSEDEKREVAKIIYDESKRMGRLVNELLDLARLEAGHFQLNQTMVSIGDFFTRITRKFFTLAKDQNISLRFEGPSDPQRQIFVDPDRIEQVLTNLIDNAIRHTESGGKVTVRVEEYAKDLRVSVTDTGTGIDEEDLPFVFERFYKADKARTRGKSGTGLGLAIAKNIVEAHQGKIFVQSKKGKGTTFTFILPNKAS
ncbi:two-component system sensor histidine kinase ResE [Pullulanibacillus pueri]|uniref:histidine kinase n=1 Tax=Pullulanibacillus pueri TaxID=1437324 RepID=A0A8J2ZUA2_9BACL|nr:ATP-binding protein [Pullulanibacillus pueri]MBM7681502.1 two-component system sensor histidine kinase ResE [Pullulanibacillus pueri]GGH79136.1 sensor histidine kinase ResE [Pullulanibacillus pueri]